MATGVYRNSHQSEYNVCKIASSRLGVKASRESLARMRKAKRGQHTGSKNPRAILNEGQARQIKILLRDGFNEHQIAPRLGVSAAVIKRIKYNKSWKHVSIRIGKERQGLNNELENSSRAGSVSSSH